MEYPGSGAAASPIDLRKENTSLSAFVVEVLLILWI